MNIPVINLHGGEATPQLDCRSDIEKYPDLCRHLENFLPRIYGPVTRRPGTQKIMGGLIWNYYLQGIVAYKNSAISYENSIVSIYADNYMPNFTCYKNEEVCFDNEPITTTGMVVFVQYIVCYENNMIFYENEITTFFN